MTSEMFWEDVWDGLLPLPGSREPFRVSVRTSDDGVRTNVLGKTDGKSKVY